jgi:hypothetical protein
MTIPSWHMREKPPILPDKFLKKFYTSIISETCNILATLFFRDEDTLKKQTNAADIAEALRLTFRLYMTFLRLR